MNGMKHPTCFLNDAQLAKCNEVECLICFVVYMVCCNWNKW